MVNSSLEAFLLQGILLAIPAASPGNMQLPIRSVGPVRTNLSSLLTDASWHKGQTSARTRHGFFPNVELVVQVTVWPQVEKFCTRTLVLFGYLPCSK